MGLFNRNSVKKALLYILSVLFIMAMLNKIVFIHTHIAADGSVVTHAHPYNKSQESDSKKQHTHTEFELFFLQNLNVFMGAIFIAIIIYDNIVKGKFRIYIAQENRLELVSVFQGRAPPFKNS